MHWKEVPTSLRPAHPSPRMTSQRSHTSSSTAGSSSDNNYGNELWHNGAGLLSEESLTDSDSHNYRSEPEKPHRSPHLCANKLRKQRPASMHSTLPTSRSGDHLPALSSPAAAEKSKRRFSLPRMTHVQPPPITEQPATPPSSARLSSIYRKRKKRQSALGETLEPYCHLPAPSSFDPMFSTPYDAVVPRAQKTGVSRQSPSNTLLHPSQLGSEHTSPPPVPKIDSVWLSASPPAAAPADVKPMPSQQIADNSGLGKPKNSKAYRLRASWSSSSQVEVQLSERRALMRSRTMQMSNRSASIDQQLSSASSLVQESRPNWDLQKSEVSARGNQRYLILIG